MASRKPLRNGSTKDLRMRVQLAQEAARLIAEEGINDFHVAKHKAAERLHAPQTHNLPRNDEIQLALNEYQRLFKADSQPQQVQRLRRISHRVMRFFNEFEPRLVGAVLDGSATEYSEITLHLFNDSPESLTLFLLNHRIPFEQCSRRITQNNGEQIEVPGYQLMLEDAPILLLLFSRKGLRQAPRDPATGKSMERYSTSKVEDLIKLSG